MNAFAYTVAASFDDASVAEEWLRWLRDGHVGEVLAAGARRAAIVRLDGDPPSLEARYEFASRDDFAAYERDHAPRLRADALRRFPPQRGVSYRRSTGVIEASWESSA